LTPLRLRSGRPGALARLNERERRIFGLLPGEMRAFYERHNGGFDVDELVFDVPITSQMGPRTSAKQTVTLECLWAFMPWRVKPAKNRPPSILREHFGRHLGEGFLPRNVLVFGAAMRGSLLAVSLNAHDHGAIYFWEWYWQYPWYKPFFLARVREADERFAAGRRDLAGREMPADMEASDARNYATLVTVAPSFDAWRAALRRDEE
jgi:hypothetical protein